MHKATTAESDFRQQLKYGYIKNEWVKVETNPSGVQH
jgi:hypothetical protein